MPYLVLLVAAAMGLWYGGDGLWVNLTSGKLTTFDIETVEKHGIGDNRYIRITGGTWSDGIVYQMNEKTHKVDHVIFALESAQTYRSHSDGKKTAVRVLVKKPANTSDSRLKKWLGENGADEESVDIQGVTRVGFDSIDDESKRLIESMNMKVDDAVIFLEEGSEPRALWMNLAMFVPSAGFFGLMVVGMFSKEEKDSETPDEAAADSDNTTHMDDDQATDAIRQVMILMMRADGDIDADEIKALQSVYSQLTDQFYDVDKINSDIQAMKADGVTLKSLLKALNDHLSDDGRRLTLEAALVMALANGSISTEEQEMLNTIETGLHIGDEVVAGVYERHGIELR